ncbi:MAG: O-antigen polysaccharide polymerase Wzy [Absicoccus porci]|uniref:O-antigen polysaccharide polymerase Wzy n=1 Tax=Absicoccus porci TaxID=2486576 RepID=UPI0023F54386|nr:O-antigen polysaccharide polymerase Wzy [Absicoccus porci]MDD7331047.1 O-antigen polysaccharide polymerase Wzy [Absicoccus porci]MDY4738007.1 O-antigen polysaccharide polymerase Wzy [Absicoccus porci]
MIISKKNFYTNILLIVAFAIVYALTVGAQDALPHNVLVYVTFGINGIFWIIMLIHELRQRNFSLILVYWLFCIFFFFFAGLIQTMNNDFPWVEPYSDNLLIETNVVLLIWSILFQFGVYKASNTKFVIRKRNIPYKNNVPFKAAFNTEWKGYESKVNILMIFAVFITGYRVLTIGFINLLARGTSSYSISDNASISVLVEKMAMAMVYFAFIFAVYLWRRDRKPFQMIITGICLLVAYFPTSTARNAIAGLYFGALLAFFPKMKKNKWFITLYLLIFMIAFPVLNAFRTVSVLDVNISAVFRSLMSGFSSEWLSVDYDAYSMVALSLQYLADHGLSFGVQFLAVIFFWVPRSIWPSKPVATGQMIAQYNGWWFTNVSEPLPAEMLVNYGIVGALISAVIIGFLLGKIDLAFWRNVSTNYNAVHKFDSLYYYMVGYFLFLYRGSLNSAVAYLVPFIVVWLVLTWGQKEYVNDNKL